jgi:hypothetical protein
LGFERGELGKRGIGVRLLIALAAWAVIAPPLVLGLVPEEGRPLLSRPLGTFATRRFVARAVVQIAPFPAPFPGLPSLAGRPAMAALATLPRLAAIVPKRTTMPPLASLGADLAGNAGSHCLRR